MNPTKRGSRDQTIIELNPRSDAFLQNAASMDALVDQLQSVTSDITKGGGEKNVQRHESRGKLFVRDRINLLIDPGSAFLNCLSSRPIKRTVMSFQLRALLLG